MRNDQPTDRQEHLSRVELYDTKKSRRRPRKPSREATRSGDTAGRQATIRAGRHQSAGTPPKGRGPRRHPHLFRMALITLLAILLITVIVFAIKQQNPVNTNSDSTSITTSSKLSHKRRSHHSSSSASDDYGTPTGPTVSQVPRQTPAAPQRQQAPEPAPANPRPTQPSQDQPQQNQQPAQPNQGQPAQNQSQGGQQNQPQSTPANGQSK